MVTLLDANPRGLAAPKAGVAIQERKIITTKKYFMRKDAAQTIHARGTPIVPKCTPKTWISTGTHSQISTFLCPKRQIGFPAH